MVLKIKTAPVTEVAKERVFQLLLAWFSKMSQGKTLTPYKEAAKWIDSLCTWEQTSDDCLDDIFKIIDS